MVASATVAAEGTTPDGIELLNERIDEGGVIGEDAVFEVTLLLALRSHPRAGKIGAAEVRLHAIHDDALEMDTRTKHPLHRRPKRRIAIEVIPPVRPRVFRMN